jgi:hypothetical protein
VKGKGKAKPERPSATLIVAPTSLLSQWAEELARSSKPGTMKVLVWHGQNRLDLGGLRSAEDGPLNIVITSYGVLASEHAKIGKTGSPVYDSGFFMRAPMSTVLTQKQLTGCASSLTRPTTVSRGPAKLQRPCMPSTRDEDGRSQVA